MIQFQGNPESTPLLTAIIPCYNTHIFRENLSSLLPQLKYKPIKVILVVGEGDVLTGVVSELKSTAQGVDMDIRSGPITSPGSARNLGLEDLSTEWFTFWDADDFPQIKQIQSLLGSEDLPKADLHVGQIQIRYDGKLTKSKTNSESSIQEISLMPAFTRMIFKTESFGRVRFPDLIMGEDRVFLSRSNFLNLKVNFSENVFYIYNQEVSILTSKFADHQDSFETINLILKMIGKSSKPMTEFHISQLLVMISGNIRRTRQIRRQMQTALCWLITNHPIITLKSLTRLVALKARN